MPVPLSAKLQSYSGCKSLEANLSQLAQTGQILKVARFGHPGLLRKAPEVTPEATETLQMIADMAATILDFGPVQGLAAPQLYLNARLLFYTIDGGRKDAAPSVPVPGSFLINASYENVGTETYDDWEACLSLPDQVGLVPRHKKIHLKAKRTDGVTFEEVDQVVEDHHARVLAHEIDHLDGIMYPQRMTDFSKLGYREEMLRYMIRRG